MTALKIYGTAQSRAFRTIWMANELGLPAETVSLNFRAGETRTPEFLGVNRAGHIPAIDDGEMKMGESCAINFYLARKHGKLIPSDLAGEAKVLEWMFWVMTDVEKPTLQMLFHAAMLPEDQRDPKIVEQCKKDLQWPMTVLDNHLKSHAWLVGDDFTIADLSVAAVLAWAKMAKFDFAPFPAVQEWVGRCLGRPAAKVR